ncbi:hypothetical protein Poly30_36260 [Planctomycetes bacterium Poly30]|uniref:Endo-1,3-beta-glucanase btgC n=1 Tax=Saltatorellus ferox TaxID=2528018 RepID=A0A518EVH4_9BACT|nr:hypothetical protein Poly30_36260 [Planctomycetes bacterium Poly30]
MDFLKAGIIAAALALVSCISGGGSETTPSGASPSPLESGVMAIAYSGFRAGQHPDRGQGAVNPSRAETLEDLKLLVEGGFDLIRLYDSGSNSAMVLDVIEEQRLPIQVLLGIWLDAEVSNHLGCPWLNEPIPAATLERNRLENQAGVERAIELAADHPDVVIAVSVGNEALVDWNDHMVPLDSVIEYVRQVKATVDQPVTVAENYRWWIDHGAALAAELDFIGVHSYPVWEGKGIDEGLHFTARNVDEVRAALPDSRIVVLEAGWATVAVEFGDRAGEAQQARYFRELKEWAARTRTTVFFFEAFDEPWKGDPGNAYGAEKHWGLWTVGRDPKQAMAR